MARPRSTAPSFAYFDLEQVSVRFRVWNEEAARRIVTECGGEWRSAIPQLRIACVGADGGISALESVRATLEARGEVEWATYEPMMSTRAYFPAVQDTLADLQWQFKRVNLYHAHKYTKGDPAIRVADIDTYLNGTAWTEEVIDYPFQIDGGTLTAYPGAVYPGFTEEDYSHGQTTSTIMWDPSNTTGGVGVCPGVYKIFGAIPEMLNGPVIGAAIAHAVDQGAKIFSFSWGGAGPAPTIGAAIAYGQSQGALFFNAAGNYNEFYSAKNTYAGIPGTANGPGFAEPGSNPGVLLVSSAGGYGGGTGGYDTPFNNDTGEAHFTGATTGMDAGSAFGLGIDFTAPALNSYVGGTFVPSYGDYGSQSPTMANHHSTSFACPIVAGIAALAWSANPALTGAQVLAILRASRKPGLHADYASRFPDAGTVDAGKAVAMARSTLPANAGVPIPFLGVDGPGAVTTISGGAVVTALDGPVRIDASGFVNGQVADYVDVFHGTRLVYHGPPAILSTTATAGSSTSLRIVAHASGVSADETYTDITAGALALSTVDPVATTVYDSDTEWHVDVPTDGLSGVVTFDAVSSTGEQASVDAVLTAPVAEAGGGAGQAAGTAGLTVKKPLGGQADGRAGGAAPLRDVVPLGGQADGRGGVAGGVLAGGVAPHVGETVIVAQAGAEALDFGVAPLLFVAEDGDTYALRLDPGGVYGDPVVALAGQADGRGAGAVAISVLQLPTPRALAGRADGRAAAAGRMTGGEAAPFSAGRFHVWNGTGWV